MGWKASLVSPFARKISQRIAHQAETALSSQESILRFLLAKAVHTDFGKDHDFSQLTSHDDYKHAVPIRDYEGHRSYIDQILQGHNDVLWPGKPKYLAKTSGTTSGIKYIPITKESIPNHFGTARNALFNYMHLTGKSGFLEGKMIFLSGSPQLTKTAGIPTGRLSGIVNHMVPKWLKSNQLPSYQTNCIEDWEAKLDQIVEETYSRDMRLISGIPPWVKMYYERLLERTGTSTIREIFPNFQVFVYGGVNYEPYRASLESLMGPGVDTLETYPASEGFIAFQDDINDDGLLLNTASGIYYEFVPASEIHSESPTRLSLAEVELGVNYAILLSTNAGLWAYDIGDTVTFTSLDPYRLRVSGRTAHYISAFGEHVIGQEVERAMQYAIAQEGGSVVEFTVAPQVNPESGLPHHEWFVEWDREPEDMGAFAQKLDHSLRQQNIYYEDLIKGAVMQPLLLQSVPKGGFVEYMKSQGKLGGQNKVPRLSNDRAIVDRLL